MPTDAQSKSSSESRGSRSGLLANCGIAISTFFVRDQRRSPENSDGPVRTTADSPKKRKRAPSPLPDRNMSPRSREAKAIDMISNNEDEDERKIDPRATFDAAVTRADIDSKYNDQHDDLIRLEQDDAWDRDARRGTDSVEERAAFMIRKLREYEREHTFGNRPLEALPEAHTRDMGGQFLTNKERIDNYSKLYEIAQMVPKGALLHLHFNAELHPELLLVRARQMNNMYVRSIRPLLEKRDLELTEMVFNVLDPQTVNPDVDIFSVSYPTLERPAQIKDPNYLKTVWMLWSTFRERFGVHFKGEYEQEEPDTFRAGRPHGDCGERGQICLQPAENWLRSKMVLSPEEAYGFKQTVNGVWARFNQATRAFKGLLNYESVYKWYIGEAIDRMIEEKVMYAELRPMLLDKYIPANDGKGSIDNAGQMKLIIESVKEKQDELKAKGELHKFPFGLKIIYCTPRSIPVKMMQEEMKQCIELKLQYKNLICGFDLVGAEDRPNHIGAYRKELLAFRETCEKLNLDIPFMFHAGETLLDTGGSSDPKNSNLYDAVLLNSKRIGHGFALMKHPHLVEKFKRTSKRGSGICVELCPISNELLHLCRNIKEHPYPELLAAGIPCTVNSDNPSLFSNSMSHEFYQIMVGAPTMSLYSWKQLARWSIEYSCLTEDEKNNGYKYLDDSWRVFCKAVIDKYGHLFDGDEINLTRAKDAYPEIKAGKGE